MHSKPLLATKQVKGSCIVEVSWNWYVLLSLQGKQKSLAGNQKVLPTSDRPSKPSLPLPVAFRPQRKVEKRTRNRYTSPCRCRIQQQGWVGKGRWAAFGRFCHRKCFAANGNQERRGLHGLQLLAFCKTKKGRKGRKQSSNVGHHHTMPPPPSPRPFPPPLPPSSLVVACTIHVVRNWKTLGPSLPPPLSLLGLCFEAFLAFFLLMQLESHLRSTTISGLQTRAMPWL